MCFQSYKYYVPSGGTWEKSGPSHDIVQGCALGKTLRSSLKKTIGQQNVGRDTWVKDPEWTTITEGCEGGGAAEAGREWERWDEEARRGEASEAPRGSNPNTCRFPKVQPLRQLVQMISSNQMLFQYPVSALNIVYWLVTFGYL